MSSPSFPTPTSPLYQLACDYVRATNAKDYAAVSALLSPNFTTQIHPSSLRTPGYQKRINGQQHIERFKQMLGEGGLVKDLNVDINHPVNVVEGEDCIVLQVNAHAKLANGKDWPQEFVYIIRFDQAHTIVAVDHWNDSALAHAAFPGSSFPKFGQDGQVTNMGDVTEGLRTQAQ